MELEAIFWARLRVLKTQTASHDGRLSTLESRSDQPSTKSAGLLPWIRRLSDLTVPLGTIIGFLARHWGLLILALTTLWALVLPVLRWLWLHLTSSAGYFAHAMGW